MFLVSPGCFINTFKGNLKQFCYFGKKTIPVNKIGLEHQKQSFSCLTLFPAEQVGPFAVKRAEALPELFQEQNHQRARGQPRVR
jgi:hypothetical protein